MVANKDRRAVVQKLRSVARSCGAKLVADSAGRTQVEAMYKDILSQSTLDAAGRKAAEDAFAEYVHSMSAPVLPLNGGTGSKQQEWNFRAGQLTYNCSTGDWISDDLTVKEALFQRLVAFVKGLAPTVHALGFSVTLEESLAEGGHVHAHVYLHLSKQYRAKGDGALDLFVFEGIRPHLETNKAAGGAWKGAVNHGHFYVVVDKKGSLFNFSNYEPFVAYKVEAWWLDNLLKAEKLEPEVYLRYASRVGVGFKRRLEDIRTTQRYSKERAMLEHVAAEAAALEGTVLPAKVFQEVEKFVEYFRGTHLRRPILVIIGGTNLGKSLLAADVLRKVGVVLGLPGFLEITVEMNEHLDFSDYDIREHSGVLLDGVGDALILKKNREALQGRPKLAKGAQSATMMYSYQYTLCKRAAVATFDLSAKNLDAFKSDHWLQNPLNVIQLWLEDTAFEKTAAPGTGIGPAAVPKRPRR